MGIKHFFENIKFSFGSQESDIKPVEITISENDELTQKLRGKVYAFKSPPSTNSSFYVITISLSDEDLFQLRRYIWNENKYDLYFLAEKPESSIAMVLYYAKSDPLKSKKIASFKGDDAKELEKIQKWKFNSGAFWADYADFLPKIKVKDKIDKKLIEQLRDLKSKLQNELNQEGSKCDEIVQALIDRTLFIKFLEDNHIINSFFYKFHFSEQFKKNSGVDYKILLKKRYIDSINKLFNEINKLFNNVLFETPFIANEYLTDKVLDLIYYAICQHNLKTGQLSLFDFRFDVIPIEFISHIYEVFLEKSQLEKGIFYTPHSLAQLIIDDTMTETGTVLDPACGSGMFLVLAFRKILKNNPTSPKNVDKTIRHRNKLLKDNIFGIEKENIAWRLTIFSLYLEILKGIRAEEIKEYIEIKLKDDSESTIFPYDFASNIICDNALEITEGKIPHVDKKFKYIVGNPPFFKIKNNDDENTFVNKYSIEIDRKTLNASEIIGDKQISQAFMLKVKCWATQETRLGFVLNSSNFYNDTAEMFQKFFFEYYQVEKFYELSHVKDILFRKAKEDVIVAIFNNRRIAKNTVKYYPVHMGTFSCIFDLLIIQEDKVIEIPQRDILNKKVILRDYLIGNEYDLKLVNKMNRATKVFGNYIVSDNAGLAVGIRITGGDKISNIDKSYNELSAEEQKDKLRKTKLEFISSVNNKNFTLPYIEYKDINAFVINIDKYLCKNDLINKKYRRNKDLSFFEGEKILFRKIPRKKMVYIYEAFFSDNILCFPDGVFCIRLKEKRYYHIITALLNSDLINYYINLVSLKRINSSFAHVSKVAIKNIPIPNNLDKDLVVEISKLSQQLSEGNLQYKGKIKKRLNTLVFDLYDLNFLERQRVKDFFNTQKENNERDLEKYKESLRQTIEIYFEDEPMISCYQDKSLGFNIIITAIYFNNSHKDMPSSKKVFRYTIRKIVKTEKFLAMREFILGEDCIYIVRDNAFKNWTISKGFEDGKEILKRLGK